ncbi:MAG: acyl-CoA thioesterase [Candidatus Azotimanducaceae bacterium]
MTTSRADRLLNVLDLKQIEENLYLGENEPENGARIFGGQVLAQASMAAYRTVSDLDAHSIHAYFLRPGDTRKAVLYEVERIRDGRSFSTRRVVAIQSGQAIFNMDISFQAAEVGLEHSLSMPNVPLPGELQEDREVAKRLGGAKADPRLSAMAKLERPFELRSVFELGTPAWAEARAWNPVWVRFMAPVTEDVGPAQPISRSLLAYASDMGLVSTGYLPHQNEFDRSQLQMASLDHSLWIHRPVPMDQWLLFHKRTSSAQGARALVHADFFSSDGQLIASVTQEGLIRTTK